jgi:hypothetical protein
MRPELENGKKVVCDSKSVLPLARIHDSCGYSPLGQAGTFTAPYPCIDISNRIRSLSTGRKEDIMALEDFAEPEVGIAAVVAAAVFSPTARKAVRRGLVYGMAGIMIAGDAISSFARGIGQGVQAAGASAANTAQNTMEEARAETAKAATGTQRKTSQRTATHREDRPAEDTGGQA